MPSYSIVRKKFIIAKKLKYLIFCLGTDRHSVVNLFQYTFFHVYLWTIVSGTILFCLQKSFSVANQKKASPRVLTRSKASSLAEGSHFELQHFP